jgi:hypothetical protein
MNTRIVQNRLKAFQIDSVAARDVIDFLPVDEQRSLSLWEKDLFLAVLEKLA